MSVIALAAMSCSIESTKHDAAERLPAKRAIVGQAPDQSRAEVLGIVSTPEPSSSEGGSSGVGSSEERRPAERTETEPLVEPTPTLTAHRVVVHASGDWIVDGDEVVTVHDAPGGIPVGVVAVGVVVSSTGSARVLGDTTWLEIELPDGQQGYVRAQDLRIGHQGRVEADDDEPTMLITESSADVSADEGSGSDAAVSAQTADATGAVSGAGDGIDPTGDTAPPETVAPIEVFVLTGWDANRPAYEVAVRWAQVWVQVGEELVPASSVSSGYVLEVLSDEGQMFGDLPMIPVRSRGFDGWIDVRNLRSVEG